MDPRRITGLPVARGRVGVTSRAAAAASNAFRTALGSQVRNGTPASIRPAADLGLAPVVHGNFGAGALDSIIHEASASQGVDESLVRAVIQAESGYRADAVSKAGAMGLMQLMPGTASGLGVKDPFDPASNVAGGTKYLRAMLDRFGSVALALAAYNAGPGAVEKYGGIPPYAETRSYVSGVMKIQQGYKAALGRQAEGSHIDEQPTA